MAFSEAQLIDQKHRYLGLYIFLTKYLCSFKVGVSNCQSPTSDETGFRVIVRYEAYRHLAFIEKL